MDEFGQAVILYLVNHAKMEQTRMSPTAKAFVLPTNGRLYRYRARSLRCELQPFIAFKRMCLFRNVRFWWRVGNMIVFTLPHENANFALQCPNTWSLP